MIELSTDGDAVLIPVQARPKAKKTAVTGIHDGRLKVAVTQAPEKGKANDAILKLLAKTLGLKRSQLELVTGRPGEPIVLAFRAATPRGRGDPRHAAGACGSTRPVAGWRAAESQIAGPVAGRLGEESSYLRDLSATVGLLAGRAHERL